MYTDETVLLYGEYFWSKCKTRTKNLKRNFSLTANWPLNQLCLLRYANDREEGRWLKLPFNSTVHCFTFNRNWLQMKPLILVTVPKFGNNHSVSSWLWAWHQCCVQIPELYIFNLNVFIYLYSPISQICLKGPYNLYSSTQQPLSVDPRFG